MRFSIREMYDAYKNEPITYERYCFLGSHDWCYNPDPSDPQPDTRKDYIKSYADVWKIDDVVVDKYGDYCFVVDCPDALTAYHKFVNNNIVYALTHDAELSMLYKAHHVDYNPIENYDRNEETTTATQMLNGGTSMVAPDDSELFTNVASGTSSANGSQTVTGHIHGNIGVTTNATMQNEVYKLYRNNAWIEYFISTIVKDSCILIDYGYNVI